MGSAKKQGELWGLKAKDWAFGQEPLHEPLWRAMLHAAGIQPGMRVFDAGCGAGGACVLFADAGAQVFGIDAAEPLIEIAWERVPIGKFQVGDIEDLRCYQSHFFDVGFAANSIQFAENPLNALCELRRVCKHRGKIAIGVWGLPQECDQRYVFGEVRNALPEDKRPQGSGPFALSMPEVLEELFQRAGIKILESGSVSCPFEYPDMETALRAQLSAGPVQAVISQVGKEKVTEAAKSALTQFLRPNDSILMSNTFKFLIGTPEY